MGSFRFDSLPATIVIAGHFLLLFTLYGVLYLSGIFTVWPGSTTLMQWDANWYYSIVEGGYRYYEGQQSNLAFFPLFPYIWDIAGLGPVGISLLNLLLMIGGIVLLNRTLRPGNKWLLLWLSVPVLFFCYVPYSEAVFFFAGSLLLYGLRQNPLYAVAGIFLACLSRSASMVFIPVLLFISIVQYRVRGDKRVFWRNVILYISSAIVAGLFVQCIQYIYIGKFFNPFETYAQWDKAFRWPSFPLTTWGGGDLLWLDGLAFLAGVLAAMVCLLLLIRKWKKPMSSLSPAWLFASGYLAMVMLLTFLSSGKDPLGRTSIYSLNRYVFATPFFLAFIYIGGRFFRWNNRSLLSFFGVCIATFLLLGAYSYLPELSHFPIPVFKTKIYFGLMLLYALLWYKVASGNGNGKYWIPLYLLNVMVQLLLFHRFLLGHWIG